MKKRKVQRPSKTQIFDYLAVLEKNEMNQSKTAQDCGIARGSIRRYHEKYWIEYLKSKEDKKQAVIGNLQEDANDNLLPSVIAEINSRLVDQNHLKSVPTSVLLSFFGNLVKFANPKLDSDRIIDQITKNEVVDFLKKMIFEEFERFQYQKERVKEKESKNIQSSNWLSEEEAAQYLGVNRRYIYTLRIEGLEEKPELGTLPYSKIGKKIRIKRTDIDKLLTQLVVKSVS